MNIRMLAVVSAAVVSAAILAAGAGAAQEDEARRADAALNAAYQEALGLLTDDARRNALRDAQRAWIAFRDSSCAFEAALRSDNAAGDWIERQTRPALDRVCVQRLSLERAAHLRRYAERLRPPPAPAPAPGAAATRSIEQMTSCRMDGLPAEFAVEAVGVYAGGTDTDVQLDASGHETKAVEVIVNRPGEDVVLVLMAYDPVLWQLKRTAATRLAGVVVGGYHDQAVLGIERSVPLRISTNTGRNDCGRYFYAYKAGPDLLRANAAVKDLTGREIDHIWSNYKGTRVHVGTAPAAAELVSADGYRPEDYTDLPRFPSGQKGLARLVELGLLRQATPADLDAWVEKASARYRRFDPALKVARPSGARGAFVVLGKLNLPAGLYGAHSVAFLIPPGIPLPDGNAGHSTLYFLEDGTCRGPGCPSDRE